MNTNYSVWAQKTERRERPSSDGEREKKKKKKRGGGKSTISSGWVGSGYIKPRHQYLGTDSASEELLAESSFRSETLSKRTQPGKNRNEQTNKTKNKTKKERERERENEEQDYPSTKHWNTFIL